MEFKRIKGQGPERVSVEMTDPIFGAGSAHTATAPITVLPSGLACEAELWLTPDGGVTKAATSGLVAFTSTGVAQSISFPVTMPTAAGVEYSVYLDVYANGALIVSFVATESVVIPSATVGPITWV